MLVSKNPFNNENLGVLIYQNLSEQSECVKYLDVYLDNKLTWKTNID